MLLELLWEFFSIRIFLKTRSSNPSICSVGGKTWRRFKKERKKPWSMSQIPARIELTFDKKLIHNYKMTQFVKTSRTSVTYRDISQHPKPQKLSKIAKEFFHNSYTHLLEFFLSPPSILPSCRNPGLGLSEWASLCPMSRESVSPRRPLPEHLEFSWPSRDSECSDAIVVRPCEEREIQTLARLGRWFWTP